MDTTTTKLTRKQAKPLLAATFPEYKGRTLAVEFRERLTFYQTYWDGGSKNKYAFVRADGAKASLPTQNPWTTVIEGQQIDMQSDVIVAKHTIFCGHDCGVTFYAHPSNLPKWIEA